MNRARAPRHAIIPVMTFPISPDELQKRIDELEDLDPADLPVPLSEIADLLGALLEEPGEGPS